MRISCPHKATQCLLMGPATENRLILANVTMPDNIARSVRRGQDQWRPHGANPRAADQRSTALRCEIAPDRGADLSAERRTGRDGDEMVDPHLKMIREVTPSAEGCEDCLRIGSRWVHLRLSVGKLRLLHDLL
jgi:hypothetical protein